MFDLPVLTVTELTHQVKDVLESQFPMVAVTGEISNCTRAASGHVYLTLNDEQSQIRANVWRHVAARLRFELHDGLEVVALGAVEVYPPRGSYQLIIEELIPKGLGPLELAFRQLREKLSAEGLFDPERKRPLPRFPRRVALVTSPTGAAVQDLLKVLNRRWPLVEVVIVPVAVQGDQAAPQIAAALARVHEIPRVDVVITGRGGGSLEDLWAFNEEIVARAIAACQVPVISAVGHEIDVSISDLVADQRALTPSEAAELVVPNRVEVANELRGWRNRLTAALQERVTRARLQLEALASRRVLTHPLERIRHEAERLDELADDLHQSMRRQLQRERGRLEHVTATLDALSPLKILGRGYSITQRADNGEIVKDAATLKPGDELHSKLAAGRITSRVLSVEPNPPP